MAAAGCGDDWAARRNAGAASAAVGAPAVGHRYRPRPADRSLGEAAAARRAVQLHGGTGPGDGRHRTRLPAHGERGPGLPRTARLALADVRSPRRAGGDPARGGHDQPRIGRGSKVTRIRVMRPSSTWLQLTTGSGPAAAVLSSNQVMTSGPSVQRLITSTCLVMENMPPRPLSVSSMPLVAPIAPTKLTSG